MIQSMNNFPLLAILAMFVTAAITATDGRAQGPMVRHVDADFEASGYVTPAGMVPPELYHGPQGGVQPVGYHQHGCNSCSSPANGGGGYPDMGYGEMGYGEMGVSSYGGCDSCGGGCDSCGGGCGHCDQQSWGCGCLLNKLKFCGGWNDGELSPLRHLCLFCRGQGCEACQYIGRGYLLGALHTLLPYREAGLCAQRWYDISAEAVFLSHNNGLGNFATTSRTADIRDLVTGDLVSQAPRVLGLGDLDSGGKLEAGLRISGAMIFGAGGNLEGTYMGGNKWGSRASVADTDPILFSFISDFGTDPTNGFDDTDRSFRQTVTTDSEFHSVEFNYRRRTVGPYCRFQGSWLVGLRYLRFDNGLGYATRGGDDDTATADLPRFFSSNDQVENKLFGPQAGFDLWWNMVPGINLGAGLKGAWVQNDVDRHGRLTANSLRDAFGNPITASVGGGDRDTTCIVDFDTRVLYRLSHSWTFTSAYHLIFADDVRYATIDRDTIRNFIDPLNNPNSRQEFQVDDLVLQGVSFGAEYIW
jgi:hypothetical protein